MSRAVSAGKVGSARPGAGCGPFEVDAAAGVVGVSGELDTTERLVGVGDAEEIEGAAVTVSLVGSASPEPAHAVSKRPQAMMLAKARAPRWPVRSFMEGIVRHGSVRRR